MSRISVAALLLPFLLGTAQAQELLAIQTYGGVWGDAQKECIADPFAKKTGIPVRIAQGISSVNLAQLQQQKDRPVTDVIWLDGGNSEQAWTAGLLAPIPESSISNLAGLASQGVYRTPQKEIYALSTGYYALGILYNTKEVKTPPTSWWDFWKPEFQGRVVSPSPAQSTFPGFFLHLNTLLGGGIDNIQPGLDKFRQLKVASYYDASGVARTAIQNGEGLLAAYYVNTTWDLVDQGLPVAIAIPKEGATAGDIRLHLVKNARNREAAEKFIDFASGSEALTCMADKLFVGPPLAKPVLSDKTRERMPWGKDGTIADLNLPDWNAILPKRAAITEQWNKTVVAR